MTTRTTPTLVDLRNKLFDTLDALADKTAPMDPERARAIVSVADVVIDSAKVEIDFMKVTGQDYGSGFIPVQNHPALPKPNNGLPVRN